MKLIVWMMGDELNEAEKNTTLTRLKCEYLRASLLLRTWIRCGYLHKAEINPFRVLWVDPRVITHAYGAVIPRNCRFLSLVLDGDWDSPDHLVEEIPQYQMLYERFKLGLNWIETNRVKDAIQKQMQDDICWTDCHSLADILSRCATYDDLFGSIKENGYLVPGGIQYGRSGITTTCIPQEIVVNIARDGRFLFWDGIHRLAIARILDIPLIPLRVLARHKIWQEKRNQVATWKRSKSSRPSSPESISHPDLAYLME